MKRLLTLSILLGTLFPGVYSEETGWSYKQTTGQAFYMFSVADLTIDGEAAEEADVIGAFTEDGGAKFRGSAFFSTSVPSLAELNGMCLVHEWDVDGEGNGTWHLWEWS